MFDNKQILIGLLIIGVIFAVMYFSNSSQTVQTMQQVRHSPPVQSPPIHSSGSSASKFTLYNFYGPRCGWSQKFMPDCAKLVQSFGDIPDISLKAIDATLPENENLAFYYNITGYPTIILVTPDRNIEYSGDRSPADLEHFVKSVMATY